MRNLVPCLCASAVMAFAGNNISFSTFFSDSTGQFSVSYPTSLTSNSALNELQKNFIKQRFGEGYNNQEPLEALKQFLSQNEGVKFLADVVSFPLPGIVQYETTRYEQSSASEVGIYNIVNGKKIELVQLFRKNWEKDVLQLLINEFLFSQNLKSLLNYSYTQEESDFVPSSAKIVGGGLEFLYSAGKIAPDAAGVQSVFLSWSTLQPYLNKNSVIFSKIKF